MTRHRKPPPPPRETLHKELRSVASAPTLKRHRKRDYSMSEETTATARPEVTTPVAQTVRDVLAERERVDKVNASRTIASQYAEARWARQIKAIAAEAAE